MIQIIAALTGVLIMFLLVPWIDRPMYRLFEFIEKHAPYKWLVGYWDWVDAKRDGRGR